jgi:hypothetical protein
MTKAACTIVSLNYLPYARVLCESYLRHHPDHRFVVLIVDRVPNGIDLSKEQFEVILVEDLAIPDFSSVAFKYDILALNTNVKPTLLKSLLNSGVTELLYIDPDIQVFQPLHSVFDALRDHSIVITPHILSPNPTDVQAEVVLLMGGVFNLGFIAIDNSKESLRFLSWWEQRCLDYAYNEPRSGMFVDQKWINLVPCLFDRVKILKSLGCNMAYWNLHERTLSSVDGILYVNNSFPLEFYHFSGIAVDAGDRISKNSDALTLVSRPDLRGIFESYRASLVRHGYHDMSKIQYAYATFDNGQYINRLTRAFFASTYHMHPNENPFSSTSRFYLAAKKARTLGNHDKTSGYSSRTFSSKDPRIRIIHALFRLILRGLGPDKYTALMKYCAHISTLRKQSDIHSWK